RRVPGEVHVDERAEGLQVESFARSIRGDNEANVALLDGFLDVVALNGGRRTVPEETALTGAGVHGYGFLGEGLCQCGSDPVGGVEILAKNNAAVFQPGFSFRPMFGQEVTDGREFWVTGFGAG